MSYEVKQYEALQWAWLELRTRSPKQAEKDLKDILYLLSKGEHPDFSAMGKKLSEETEHWDHYMEDHAQLCSIQRLDGSENKKYHYPEQKLAWCSGTDCRTCFKARQHAAKQREEYVYCRLCGYNITENELDNTTDLCTQCQEGEDMSEEWISEDGRMVGWGTPPPGAKYKRDL